MSYQHILVAVDLSKKSKMLIEKAISIARPYKTNISIIHVNINYSDIYTGLININFDRIQNLIHFDTNNALKKLSQNTDFKFSKIINGQGELSKILMQTIKKYNIDLLVCGHHQDFLSKFMSSARQIINTIKVDVLVIPFK